MSLPNTSSLQRPSFVTGTILSGGGPTHYDDYHSIVLLLAGEKTFHIAPPHSFDGRYGKGKKNERLDKTPFDDSCHLWRRADLRAGDVLFLPAGWWHYVSSTPHCIMTNIWIKMHDDEL